LPQSQKLLGIRQPEPARRLERLGHIRDLASGTDAERSAETDDHEIIRASIPIHPQADLRSARFNGYIPSSGSHRDRVASCSAVGGMEAAQLGTSSREFLGGLRSH